MQSTTLCFRLIWMHRIVLFEGRLVLVRINFDFIAYTQTRVETKVGAGEEIRGTPSNVN